VTSGEEFDDLQEASASITELSLTEQAVGLARLL
jgi:hypothetical protein